MFFDIDPSLTNIFSNSIINSNNYNYTYTTLTNPFEKINIIGIEIEIELNFEFKIAIANLNFNGYKYWNYLKKAKFSFGYENDKKLDNQVKILSRQSKLKKILL